MESITESELGRLGRHYAVLIRTAVVGCACAAALVQEPGLPVTIAVAGLGLWTAVYVRHSSSRWLLPADTLVIVALCLTQALVVPDGSLSDSTNWVLALVSITAVAHQWFTTATGAVLLTITITAAHLAGVLIAAPSVFTATVPIGLWTLAEATLSRILFLLVRTGARRADLAVAAIEAARRAAAVASARRADEREHLAVLHDTAAATLLAVGARMVTGTEPWLAGQAGRDLEALAAQRTRQEPATADLVLVLDDLVHGGPVAVTVLAPATVPMPAAPAKAIAAATEEALRNVARHAGVDTAAITVAGDDGVVTVDITDRGAGFAPEDVSPHRRGVSGSISERMSRAGGRATITTAPGTGTRVRLEWPHD